MRCMTDLFTTNRDYRDQHFVAVCNTIFTSVTLKLLEQGKMTSKEDYLKNWGFENSFKQYSVSLELLIRSKKIKLRVLGKSKY